MLLVRKVEAIIVFELKKCSNIQILCLIVSQIKTKH